MKDNRTPRDERIRRRINRLRGRIEEAHWHPPGTNPYWACRHCEIRDPSLSVAGDHPVGCPLRGMTKQIAYWESQLSTAERCTSRP